MDSRGFVASYGTRWVSRANSAVSGVGSLNASERKRRAREIVQQSGVDTPEYFERTVLSNTGITFGEQAVVWFALMSNPRRIGKNGLPTSKGTLDTWNGIVERCKTEFGDLPLAALCMTNSPLRT